ncbi:MAG TPA: L,D-transpeptidase [Chloroflexota bacterium]|nr:L,D-transpeptidase [Chloroflexota bacterium]
MQLRYALVLLFVAGLAGWLAVPEGVAESVTTLQRTVLPSPSLPSPSATPSVPVPTPSPTATSSPPPASPTPPAPVSPTPTATSSTGHGIGQWVSNHQPLELWSSPAPDAVSLGHVPPGNYFELTGSGTEQRLFVYYPRIREYAWIDVDAIGPAPPPPASYGAMPPVIAPVNLPGRTLAFNVRSWPRVSPETLVRQVPHNSPVFVIESVLGDDGEVWYRIGEDEYIHASGVRLPTAPPQFYPGRWIDVELAEPTLMTAYEDDRIVYTALALRGTTVNATPTGVYRILRRVANETMDSSTIGIPRDAPGGYYLENVLFTQYFTNDGAAIHYNYWSSHFGYAGTHGCLGLNYDDALWFWNWASIGTIVQIR